MLNEMNFLKETIDSGASPQRVATIKDYDEFEAAAQARNGRDVPGRRLPVSAA